MLALLSLASAVAGLFFSADNPNSCASAVQTATQTCVVFQVFFCKYNDPLYVKMEKLEIMIKLANERNIDQVSDCLPAVAAMSASCTIRR